MSKKNDQSNLVKFPQVDALILEKIYKFLDDQNYEQAEHLLIEALTFDPNNAELSEALLITYIESNQGVLAQEFANELLKNHIGDFYKISDLYLTALLQFETHVEVNALISQLLEIPNLRKDYYDYLMELRRETNRVANIGKGRRISDDETKLNVDEILNNNKNEKMQMLLMNQLEERNIRPYLNPVQTFLNNDEASPFIKTIIINQLMEQEISSEMTVIKFDELVRFVPTDLEAIDDNDFFYNLKDILIANIEQNDPVLYYSIITLVERCLFLLFPLKLTPENVVLWAAAFHLYGAQYYDGYLDENEILLLYNVKTADLNEACDFIGKIDKVELPDL